MAGALLLVTGALVLTTPEAGSSVPQRAAVIHYPACDPVAKSLQTCVDDATSTQRDPATIQLDTDDAALQSVTVDSKWVRLVSPHGSRHEIGRLYFTDTTDPAEATPTWLQLERVAVTDSLQVLLSRVPASKVSVIDSDIGGAVDGRGMYVSTSVSASVSVVSSRIRATTSSGQPTVMNIRPTLDAGERFDIRVVGSLLTGHGSTTGANAFFLDALGAGDVSAVLANNDIYDTHQCGCGAGSTVTVLPEESTHADVQVVGNTFDLAPVNGVGLTVPDPGATMRAAVLNNTFSRLDRGIYAENPGRLTLAAGHNNFWDLAHGNYTDPGLSLGSDNLKVDPRFVDAAHGDLRLRPTSRLVDSGLACGPAPVAMPDASGRARVAGREADIGAHERGGSSRPGVVRQGNARNNTLDGTRNADVLCGFGGTDRLKGGPGDDFLSGGAGHDRIFAGGGRDRLLGGLGPDVLCARDGLRDAVVGGAGRDTAVSDRKDRRVQVERKGGKRTC